MIYKKIIFLCLLLINAIIVNACPYNFSLNQIDLGYHDKSFFSNEMPHIPSPIFWDSKHKSQSGFTSLYERMLCHSQKYFSVHIGGSISDWEVGSKSEVALSGFFALRFWPFHLRYFSPYLEWSIAAPTFISERILGTANLGTHFIFQDFLGVGAWFGDLHRVDVSLKLYHYSNGDLFLHNSGLDVPWVISVGYAF